MRGCDSAILRLALVGAIALGAGCATPPVVPQPAQPRAGELSVLRSVKLAPALEERILAIDPQRVTEADVKLLARGPTPRIVNIHGGIYPVHLAMTSFSEFLVGMGYPEARIRHPSRGDYSHSPYEPSQYIAGAIAWYYEHEGVRPLIVGHSQGGMQAVKVLHELNGAFADSVAVWNPLTDTAEERVTIVDPFSGRERPVIGLKVPYASAVGAGGAATLLPNQWIMATRLRAIPNTVEDFTGFFIALDTWAWNVPGSASFQRYEHNGTARIRNVELPAYYNHVLLPVTDHLARDPAMREFVNRYTPAMAGDTSTVPSGESQGLLWAADVWYSIKQHWASEAQRVIRASRAVRQTN